MLTIIVAGRNDDYGRDFRQRLFRTASHNSALLQAAGIEFEYILAEWNPLPGRPLLSEEFVDRVPNGRSVIIPEGIHQKYSLNHTMPFHEMAAKNAALRRARGDVVIVTNADILFGRELVQRVSAGGWEAGTLYRAHRISGEGHLCPPYYLGAGGDFCLASRDLWHALGGFNERIRFSTRGKDWQFFLSAAAQGIRIEFIGNVYHADHDGGFRSTSPEQSHSSAAHFGKWWDIEFGLPVTNRSDWGFSGVRERPFKNDCRMIELESKDYVIRGEEDCRDQEIMAWLTRHPESRDTEAAVLLHAICAAHREGRRLICRVQTPALAVTLSGFDSVASRFGVEIHCNWDWARLPGYLLRPFAAEPAALRDIDWVVEETDCGLQIVENGSGAEIDVHPQTTAIDGPEFNPVLARRLLHAYLRLQEKQSSKVAIYGAGSHTQSLLQWGVPDELELMAIIESDHATPREQEDTRIPRMSLSAVTTHLGAGVAILLSSPSFESDMQQACRDRGITNVIALYGDWPRDLWADPLLFCREVYA